MPGIEKFLGLKNTASNERLRPGDLLSADNVYLDDTGRVSRRDGLTEVIAGAAHSLWADDEHCFFCQGTVLKRYFPDGSVATIRSDMSGNPVSYYRIGDAVYYSDGVVKGEFVNDRNLPWGVVPPDLPLIAETAGNLPPGRYGYTATSIRSDGLESGAKAFAVVELISNGGITFTAPDDGEWYTAFYMTPTDGDEYYLVGMAKAGESVTIADVSALTRVLSGINAGPPPAGHIVSHYRGVALVAKDNWLYYSLPYMYHLFKVFGYIPVDSRVTIVAPVNDGVYVASEKKTVFLSGASPESFEVIEVADYGAIEGTLVVVPSSDLPWLEKVPAQTLAMWVSSEGVCLAGAGGLFINMTEPRYRFDAVADRGASLVVTMGSTKQLIASIE